MQDLGAFAALQAIICCDLAAQSLAAVFSQRRSVLQCKGLLFAVAQTCTQGFTSHFATRQLVRPKDERVARARGIGFFKLRFHAAHSGCAFSIHAGVVHEHAKARSAQSADALHGRCERRQIRNDGVAIGRKIRRG